MKIYVLQFVVMIFLFFLHSITGGAARVAGQVARPPCEYTISLFMDEEVMSCSSIKSIQFEVRPPSKGALDRTADPTSAAVSQLIVSKTVDRLSPYLEWSAVSGASFKSARITIRGPGHRAGPMFHEFEYQLSSVRIASYESDKSGRQAGERISFIYDSIAIVYAAEYSDGSQTQNSFAGRAASFMPSEIPELHFIPITQFLYDSPQGATVRFGDLEGGIRVDERLGNYAFNDWSPLSSMQIRHQAPTVLAPKALTEIVISKPIDLSSTSLMTAAIEGGFLSSIQINVSIESKADWGIRNWIHEITLYDAIIKSYTVDGSDLTIWRSSQAGSNSSGLQERISIEAASQSVRSWTVSRDGTMTESFGWQWPR